MIDAYDLTKIKNKKLRDYMVKYLTMMMTVSSVFLIKEGSEESLLKREELWEYLKNKNKIMYRMINKMALSKPMQFRSKAGRKIVVILCHRRFTDLIKKRKFKKRNQWTGFSFLGEILLQRTCYSFCAPPKELMIRFTPSIM